MNTVLIRPEDIGSWKNYLGYLLLFFALVDSIYLLILLYKKAGGGELKFFFLKALALVVPFYFVFYPPLHGQKENPKVRNLWAYVFIGFLVYGLAFLIFNITKSI
jgi:hypothetical protein